MNQHVSGLTLPKEKVSLWTPWGIQKVPDLDRALSTEKPRKLPRPRRKAMARDAAPRNEG